MPGSVLHSKEKSANKKFVREKFIFVSDMFLLTGLCYNQIEMLSETENRGGIEQ